MAVPHEASELERFTPDSLANLPSPPVFLLRAGSRRDRNTYQRILMQEGLTRHGPDTVRAETLRGLKALWSEGDYETNVPRLKAYWEAVDQYSKSASKDPFVYDPDEQRAVLNLMGRISEAWEPLRKLGGDNIMFAAEAPGVILSVVLMGWEGDLPTYSRQAGVVSLDLIEKLEDRLGEIERTSGNIKGIGKPGTAMIELCVAAGRRMFLSEDEEKNSESPPPSSTTRRGSRKGGKGKGPGSSKASANSKKTPAAS